MADSRFAWKPRLDNRLQTSFDCFQARRSFLCNFIQSTLLSHERIHRTFFPHERIHQLNRHSDDLISWRKMSSSSGLKKLIRVDVVSDTICPWCFVGKKRLEKAMDETKELYTFEVKWHPYMLDPTLPKEGIDKNEYHRKKFGPRTQSLVDNIDKAFQSVGFHFGSGGKIGNTLDSHRLIELAGRQGLDKQNAVVESLMIKCLTQEKCVSDREVLLNAAESAGIEGAKEWIDNPNAGLKEIQSEMEKYGHNISGVPHFKINDKYELSGAQAPRSFIQIFQKASQELE